MKAQSRQLKKIFISHASADHRFADRVATTRKNADIPTWYSRTHLRGAQQWQAEIGHALRHCDWFVVILSPSAVKSMWVKRELSYALMQRRFENKIVPVLYRNCDFERLHWALAGFQMIDATRKYTVAAKALLRIW